MKVAIMGAGGIAATFANTMSQVEGVECYAIASRTLEKAQAFAKKWEFEKAYGSYEELVEDPAVELVYIATPHSCHYENIKLCLEHGKHVLCEKAFTMNAKQAKEVKALAAEKKCYLAEAIWVRYMPSRAMIGNLLREGTIGEVKILTANLCYPASHVERMIRPELAGGALLDLGVYGLNFAVMHFGKEIERIESAVHMNENGVDDMETITLFFKDGRMAVLTHSFYPRSDRKGIFYGDKGYMIVENINNPESISIYNTNDKLLHHIPVPPQISGYEYQLIEAMEQIKAGETESVSMPMDETVFMMELMDSIRKQWGLVYPQEQ